MTDPIHLRGLYRDAADRIKGFGVAVRAFQEALDITPETIDPPIGLDHDDYHSALTLQMHALGLVCAHRDQENDPTREELSTYLLEHEARYWHTSKTASVTGDQVAATVFYATAFGPADNAAAARQLLIDSNLASGNAAARQLVEAHERLYPARPGAQEGSRSSSISNTNASKHQYLIPLRPDRLGEDYLAEYLSRHPQDREHLSHLLTTEASKGSIESTSRRRCLRILAAASQRHPTARETLWAALRARPDIATTPVIRAVINNAPRDLAELVSANIPRHHREMLAASRDLSQHLLLTLPPNTPPEQRAALLYSFGIRSGRAGYLREGVSAAADAVDIYSNLAASQPRAYRAQLAASLNSLGFVLAKAGEKRTALARTKESVWLYRRLAAAEPLIFRQKLAITLGHLSIRLGQANDKWGSLRAIREAVHILEELESDNPETCRPHLARNLHNLGRALARTDNESEALIHTTEAVRLYQELAHEEPDKYRYRPELARSLLNKSVLTQKGNIDSALRDISDAVTINRSLEKAVPDAYRPQLARSLEVAARMRQTKDLTGALRCAREAAQIYEHLAAEAPGLYTDSLRAALSHTEQLKRLAEAT
ncbi:hypothetical protein [Streptomyces sp. NPDC086835]|uniref:hypothetical protein n=1 Tax=Streptomyces sp. NPDC086835 TaxID=3365761 RepID=UPI0038207C21